ncbi:MAG: bleomycin resistance protein [Betaproteobacteria bacterium]|nr:bleomycin resistance protein [Betaproteobacteria bacterium]
MKIADISHVNYYSPGLDAIEAFMTDFGLVTAHRTPDALYMRGTGPAAYCYTVRKADKAGFAGVALRAASAADFEAATRIPGASAPRALSGPGGGMSIALKDPDGLPVEVVHGIAPAAPLAMREPLHVNFAGQKNRRGAPQRIPKGPAQILRLGHALFFATDFQRTLDWYCNNFGLLPSDYIHEGTQDRKLGAFLRCDRGTEWTDHHSIGVFKAPKAKIHHASFEIQDFDAQVLGHEWLREKGYKHVWGIGRHLLGSQIFDYWYDPHGHIVEHFADGDLFDASKPAQSFIVGPDSLFQWGPPLPEIFFA